MIPRMISTPYTNDGIIRRNAKMNPTTKLKVPPVFF